MSRAWAHGPSFGMRLASAISGATSARAKRGSARPPQPATASAAASGTSTPPVRHRSRLLISQPHREPGPELLRQAGRTHLCLRLLDRIRNPPEGCPPRRDVNQQPGRARVAVTGLPDGAGVEEPPGAGGLDDRLIAGEAALDRGPVRGEGEGEGDVAVADEDDRPARHEHRLECDLLAQHVLPDRVAGAPVEEIESLAPAGRLERPQPPCLLV